MSATSKDLIVSTIVYVTLQKTAENVAQALRDAEIDAQAEAVLSNLEDIPYDIRPIYPDGI